MNESFRLKLRGDTLVCIDWANVYGWQKKLKWQIDAQKLIEYFKTYPEKNKQVIIVSNPGSLGKEYRSILKGLFVCNVKKIREFVEK